MKVYVECYGCTLNVAENEALLEGLLKRGWERVYEPSNAEVIILATCTVIERTERDMITRIKKLSQYGRRMVITGCMASAQQNLLHSLFPQAILLSPGNYKKFLEVLGISKEELVLEPKVNDVVAGIPIANGCLGRCSYCITKLARGRLRSVPLNELKEKVRICLKKGAKEIRLTAQDSAAYGVDIGTNLAQCIKEISSLRGEFMLRIGMMNPQNVLPILPELISAYRQRKVFKFLHLPVQSGSDAVLAHMHRGHTVKDFCKIVEAFRAKFRKFTLSTDIIVGYPTEQESDFEETVKLIANVKPDIVNVTRFSPRPGTPAAKLKPLAERTLKERSRILTQLRFSISRKNLEKRIGKREKVLVCERGKRNTYIARTVDYKPVVIEGDVKLGSFIEVEIVGATNVYLIPKSFSRL